MLPDAEGDLPQSERLRVLMLTHRVPFPPDRGDRIRSYHFLRHLARHAQVWLGSASDEPVTRAQHETLRQLTVDYQIQPMRPLTGKLRGLASLVLGGPITPAYFYRRSLARTVTDWHREHRFHALFTFCTGMIGYARDVVRVNRQLGSPLRHVIDLVDVDSEKWREYAETSGPPMRWVYQAEADRLRQIESGRRDDFDAITLVSDAEAETYRQHVGVHPGLQALRQAVDVDYYPPLPDSGSQSIVFVGALDYKPNVDGVCWFVREVLTRMPVGLPTKLKIVGHRPGSDVRSLAGPRVDVVGPVDDVRDYLREAAVVIAPLRIARGVQTKVLEGMASARTVLCSPAAARGIVAEPGHHLVVEATAEGWAASLERLLRDPDERQRIAEAARAHVESVYRWEHCLAPLVPLLQGAT
jgi:sugar transferase (PEP-CTERM/EpsH1 system associated)